MIILRLAGYFLFFCAAVFLVRDITASFGVDHGLKPKTVGDVYNVVMGGTAEDFEGYVLHDYGRTWWKVLLWAFSIWAWVALFVPGMLLFWLGRPFVDKPYKRISRKAEMQQHNR